MGQPKAKTPRRELDPTKKCPYCSTYVKLDADRCDACNRRIGPANPYGMAKKPTNFKSYIIAVLAVAVFAAYLVWGFGK